MPSQHRRRPDANREPTRATAQLGWRRARRGSLLAVCGLCGGAGASTLAYLIAALRAEQQGGPVLVCDTGGPAGGLAAYAEAPLRDR